jgi:hypothetical protein
MTGGSVLGQFVGSQVSHEYSASMAASSMNSNEESSTIRAHGYRPELVSDPSSSASYISELSPGKFYPEYKLGTASGFSGLEQALWPLSLYFSWDSIFAPFNKKLFLEDFHHGRRRYCSSLLINAILAL